MIFKKDEEDEDEYLNLRKDLTKCWECKCLLSKKDSYNVYLKYNSTPVIERYCQKCKPNYTGCSIIFTDGGNTDIKFYKEIEVTEQGEPIGYIKKK